MIRHARAGLTSVALAAALLASIAAPAGAIPRPDARIASTQAVLEASSHGAGPLRNLPTSLLVTLRPGVGPEAADAIAAGHGLVRVAWNPTLRTAQYMATTGSTDPGSLATAALVARRVDGGARARLLALGRDLRGARGVVAVAAPVQLKVAEAPAGIAGAAGALPAAASAADAAAPVPTPTPVATPTLAPVDVPPPVAPPNDTYWAAQWGLEAIGIRSAWAITRGRPEIVVAVVDTGVDATHPDLAGR